ncbi:cytochrome P450 [Fomes fomentarius]|nr:cytochrome P450 [Fomes fomentarius]
MAFSFPLAAVVAAFAYMLWRLLNHLVVRSSLDNLSGPAPDSLIMGSLDEVFNRQGWRRWEYLNDTYGPTYVITGLFGEKILQTYDPKFMHSILIKDVEHWPKTLAPTDDLPMLLGPGLLTTEGKQHRRQRKMLNPVFSDAHLRNMTHIFYDIAHRLRSAMERTLGKEAQEIDVNGWMSRTTLEMLGQAGLGYSFDDFTGETSNSYGESLGLFFPVFARVPLLGRVVAKISYVLPEKWIRAICRVYPMAELRRLIRIADTMDRRSEDIVDEKKAALTSGDEELLQRVGEGKDIMSILLKANITASTTEKLTDRELVAQMSIFILAGMDTTSNALTRILHTLAQHPYAQEKLRAEIIDAQGSSDVDNGVNIDYDHLVKLPYLDAVCRETLRLYAPVEIIGRRARRDMNVPLHTPVRGRDGSMMNDVSVTKGTLVILHIQAINTRKALWGEDATEWRPERWLGPLPAELEEARIPGVYSQLMSFSGGSRSCIGFKFSQLEMKVVLAVLLAAFKFELTDKPVAWNSSPISYPTMGEESTKPELLLKVQAL